MFFDRYGQQGLIDGYWAIDTYPLNLQPGFEYTMIMKKTVSKKFNFNGSCIEEKEMNWIRYSYLKCIENYSHELLQKVLNDRGHKLCWIPQADLFIRLTNASNIEACQTTKEIDNLNTALQYTMDKSRKKDSGCIKPCIVPTINTKIIQNKVYNHVKDPRANFSYIFFHWEDDQAWMEEEYLLMDIGSLSADIGGSLGLFLGFSCLEFMRQFLKFVELLLLKYSKGTI